MKILVVSPHPDDETLGAGGTLLKYRQEGHEIFWLNITNVSKEITGGYSLDFIEQRKRQIEEICKFYKFYGFYDLAFEPSNLDTLSRKELINGISTCFQKVKPEWIIIPDGDDAHSDHRIVYESCLACSKIFRYPFIKKITTMEILSETDFGLTGSSFIPTLFVDISDYIDEKIVALERYDTEISDRPFPRNSEAVRALATLRGGMAGVMYAEAFKIIKEIV